MQAVRQVPQAPRQCRPPRGGPTRERGREVPVPNLQDGRGHQELSANARLPESPGTEGARL